jgi:cell division septation protein DedD
MIREFHEEELEQAKRADRDTELTLSTGTLLALGCSLLVLCGVCFALGYAAGHRSDTASTSVLPHSATPGALQTGNSTTKPMAGAQAPPARTTVVAAVPEASSAAQAISAGVPAGTASEEQPQARHVSPAEVRPALVAQDAATQPAQPASSLHVQPALAQVQGWMVQIAAVSHAEDAEVLVNALKRRGYAVTVRRDIADSLLHVQTGPFVNRNDANAMRQKLLKDGYNAIVQP